MNETTRSKPLDLAALERLSFPRDEAGHIIPSPPDPRLPAAWESGETNDAR